MVGHYIDVLRHWELEKDMKRQEYYINQFILEYERHNWSAWAILKFKHSTKLNITPAEFTDNIIQYN